MLKKFIKKLLNKQSVVDLDNDGKIESYREEIKGVFSQFKTMHDKLTTVNGKLQEVVQDEIRTVEEATKRREKAETELQLNIKLQEKVKDFIL